MKQNNKIRDTPVYVILDLEENHKEEFDKISSLVNNLTVEDLKAKLDGIVNV